MNDTGLIRALVVIAIGVSLIFKPTWYLKSTGEVFEKKKRNLKFIGFGALIIGLGQTYLAVFNP
jgi:uncharacterized protein YjeT (DUF2065 family)